MSPAPDVWPDEASFSAVRSRLRAWRTAHPEATLRDIEVATDRYFARLRADLVTELAQQGTGKTRPRCPTCGIAMQGVGQRTRTVLTTQNEPLMLQGQRYRCPACGTGLFPPG